MKNSFWVKPPHIPVTIPERLPGESFTGHPVAGVYDARV